MPYPYQADEGSSTSSIQVRLFLNDLHQLPHVYLCTSSLGKSLSHVLFYTSPQFEAPPPNPGVSIEHLDGDLELRFQSLVFSCRLGVLGVLVKR